MRSVLVGMSGGIDSSVSAYLLKEKGYNVNGISFILWEARTRQDINTCCSIHSIRSAEGTARELGIDHYTADVRKEFIEHVIEPFIDDYKNGRTPNPCILCNKYIKFPFLLKIAEEKGYDFVATGHYAGIENGKTLNKGIDQKKDQSYFLYILAKEWLKRIIFPLGEFTKESVRDIAGKLNLPAARRVESQDICFIEGNNYKNLLKNYLNEINSQGPILDIKGKRIGTHNGLYGYTIGQRKGIGIPRKEPLYVLEIDPVKNSIVVGKRDNAMRTDLTVTNLNWIIQPSHIIRTENDNHYFKANVKIRSTMKEQPAEIYYREPDNVKVIFNEPRWAPAKGQSAVFYHKDTVLGGGSIK